MLSIIIPTRNRLVTVIQTVNSILGNSGEKDEFEILVVDNNSDKYEIKELLAVLNHPKVRVFSETKIGLVYARHAGVKLSKGNILAFIDDDIIVGDYWLPTLLSLNDQYLDINLFTGSAMPIYQSYPPSWLRYFWDYNKKDKINCCYWLSLIDFGPEIKLIDPNLVWGLNFIIRKNAILKYEGFHPDVTAPSLLGFVGDGETGLTMKMKSAGEVALYLPDLLIHHIATKERLSKLYFLKRAYVQGISDSFAELKRKKKYSMEVKSANFFKFLQSFRFLVQKKLMERRKFLFLQEFEFEKLKGFNFHQELYNSNQEISKWVDKSNYIEW